MRSPEDKVSLDFQPLACYPPTQSTVPLSSGRWWLPPRSISVGLPGFVRRWCCWLLSSPCFLPRWAEQWRRHEHTKRPGSSPGPLWCWTPSPPENPKHPTERKQFWSNITGRSIHRYCFNNSTVWLHYEHSSTVEVSFLIEAKTHFRGRKKLKEGRLKGT